MSILTREKVLIQAEFDIENGRQQLTEALLAAVTRVPAPTIETLEKYPAAILAELHRNPVCRKYCRDMTTGFMQLIFLMDRLLPVHFHLHSGEDVVLKHHFSLSTPPRPGWS